MIPEELRKPFFMFALVFLAVYVGLLSIYVFRMGNDNPVEEAAEDIIEHVSGIQIDLSEGEELW